MNGESDSPGESARPRAEPLSPAEATVAPSFSVTEKAGDRIGRYKLLQQIGEGGWGVVYMAEQEEPVRRRVALKVIKPGMDSRQVLARFEAERQALALMDHPNIARVLDAGTTETGRPFFVMELVRGVKITDYCDQRNLPTDERLELFIRVCQAVQHAHQKGIIHRDLKPSNIMVTLDGGELLPKVIDFGIAKATSGQTLTDKTLFTAFEQFIGTPAYMSPEQAEMAGLDVDTRSDIYSLGVLLYELLSGKTPFDAQRLVSAGLDECRRIIRDEEPPRPSTRLSTLSAEEQTSVAKRRHCEPPKLIHTVRGDLDWIVMKCLEKDRARRYDTANGLAMDVQRHLRNEPILARPPSGMYRLQKLVRRNKLVFGAGTAVVAALIAGLAVATWALVKEQQTRRKAEAEAMKSREVARFLQDALAGVDPSVSQGLDTTLLKTILEKTAARIGKDLMNQPEVEAELRFTVARVYLAIRQPAQAEAMGRQALALWKSLPGHEEGVANELNQLSIALRDQRRPAEARTTLEEALKLERKLFGQEHLSIATSLHLLAGLSWDRPAEAERLYREALTMRRKLLGEEHDDIASGLNNLAMVIHNQGRFAESESTHREALAMYRKLHGNDHPGTAWCLTTLARVLASQGKLLEAEEAGREALTIHRKLHDDGWARTTEDELERVLEREGKSADAEPLLRDKLARAEKLEPNGSSQYELKSRLGECLMNQKRYGEAEPLLLSAYTGLEQKKVSVAKLKEAASRLARFYQRTTNEAGALEWKTKSAEFDRIAALDQAKRFRDSAERGEAASYNALAWLLATHPDAQVRNGMEAVRWAEKAVAASNRKDPQVLDTLAAAHAEAGDFEKAVDVQTEAIRLLQDKSSQADFGSRLRLYQSKTPYRETQR